jgi:hypothetical protein
MGSGRGDMVIAGARRAAHHGGQGLMLERTGAGDKMARSRRRSVRLSRRPEPPDETPMDLGGAVRQVGLFEAINGLPHFVAAGVVGIVIGLVALLGRPVARLLRSVTRR